MTELSEKESSLRAYLLGELTPDEQRRIEEQLLSENDDAELLLIVQEELIDSYVSDRLSERERKQLQNHFLNTTEGRRKLRMAKALRRYVNNQPIAAPAPAVERKVFWWQKILMPAWQAAVAAMLMLGLGLGVYRVAFYQSPVDKGRAALQAAVRKTPTEGQLTNFNLPPNDQKLGPLEDNIADQKSFEIAQVYLHEAARTQQSAESHYALGYVYLAKREWVTAIDEFELARKDMPKNAKLHSDMGAAFLEMAKLEMAKDEQEKDSASSSEYFNKSLESLDQALELDPSLLAALFNRALCYQEMKSPSKARDDWQEYLSRDTDPLWAEAARRHLNELEDQNQNTSQSGKTSSEQFLSAYDTHDRQTAWKVVSQNREIDRFVWSQLLDDFIKKRAAGKPVEANANLEALRYVGKLELELGGEEGQRKGDPYISEIAEFYASTSLKQQADLSEAREQMKTGYDIKEKNEEAIDYFTKARKTFAGMGNQWEALLADFLIGYCQIEIRNKERCKSLFEQLAEHCQEKRYLWLQVMSLYCLGMMQDRLDDHSGAIDSTKKALEISKEINDFYNIQRCLGQLADQYRKLGNYELSSTYLNSCLKQISIASPGNGQMWRNYDQLTQVLTARQLNAAAAAYASEALRLAQDLNSYWRISVSYVHLALTLSKQQDYAEAIKMAQLGFGFAPTGDEKAYASLQLGHLHRLAGEFKHAPGEFNQALGDYDQAIEYIASISDPLPVLRYEAYKGRLFCLFKQGEDVQKEFDRTIMLLENDRQNILEEQDRNTFFDRQQSVFDAAIDFEYSKKDYQKAFEYSDKSHGRSLLDIIAKERPALHPLEPAEVQQMLPDQTQIVEYIALDDKLLICLVSKSDFSVKEVAIGLNELTDKVNGFRDTILGLKPEFPEQAQELYNLLIKPIELSSEKGEQICIVPDKFLNYLPFGALISPASGRYLIEDYQLTIAHSAAIYLAWSEGTNHTTDRDHERLLAVGDAHFDSTVLGDLHSTRRQVWEIAKFYPSRSVLTDRRATEEAVKRGMEESDVIHLASHYVVDKSNPMNSRLVLAREPHNADSSAGFLEANEVYGLKLQQRAPLVILSACDSGVEGYYKGEGMIGMSRAFIAAGAPMVVASLWKVDAYATGDLMINFHKHRKSDGLSTPEALRRAQLDMLKNSSKKHPYYWAGFATIGARADF